MSGFLILLATIIGTAAGAWDSEWHTEIGRDSPFIVPHVIWLGCLSVSGSVALGAVLLESISVYRGVVSRGLGTTFACFHGSLGSFVSGFGAVITATGFPLDAYWHSIYGIDQSIWAPFHLMMMLGLTVVTLGAGYTLASAAHLAVDAGQRLSRRLGTMGVVFAIGMVLFRAESETSPALGSLGRVHLLSTTIEIYPFLVSLFAAAAIALAIGAIPRPGVATAIGLIMVGYRQVVVAIVPYLINYEVRVENQVYLDRAQVWHGSVAMVLGVTPWILLATVAFDVIFWLGQRKRWRPFSIITIEVVTSTLAMVLVSTVTLYLLQQSLASAESTAIRELARGTALNIPLTLFLSIPGTIMGAWLCLDPGRSLHQVRQ